MCKQLWLVIIVTALCSTSFVSDRQFRLFSKEINKRNLVSNTASNIVLMLGKIDAFVLNTNVFSKNMPCTSTGIYPSCSTPHMPNTASPVCSDCCLGHIITLIAGEFWSLHARGSYTDVVCALSKKAAVLSSSFYCCLVHSFKWWEENTTEYRSAYNNTLPTLTCIFLLSSFSISHYVYHCWTYYIFTCHCLLDLSVSLSLFQSIPLSISIPVFSVSLQTPLTPE